MRGRDVSESDRTFWEGQASTFDVEPDHGLADARTREAWRRLLIDHLPPSPADVVDLGCGTGTLSVLLAREGFRVRGLDFAEAMVAAADAKAARAGVDIAFARGDAASPPYELGSCDVVLSRHVLWALPDPARALATWVRLLRPGGRLVLIEGQWSTGSGLSAVACETLLREHREVVDVTFLRDPVYWGSEITDERYVAVSSR